MNERSREIGCNKKGTLTIAHTIRTRLVWRIEKRYFGKRTSLDYAQEATELIFYVDAPRMFNKMKFYQLLTRGNR